MATETVLDIVAILRKCRACGQYKPLEHFVLMRQPNGGGPKSVKVCAACRGNTRPSVAARSVERRQSAAAQAARIPS